MFQIALDLESSAVNFSPIVLIASGLIMLICGLFIWLGGLGMRKPLMAAIGALAGAACVWIISSRNAIFTAAAAFTGAVIAVFIQKTAITLVAAVLAGVITFCVFAEIQFGHPTETASVSRNTRGNLSPVQSLKTLTSFGPDIKDKAIKIFRQLPPYCRLAIVISVLIVIPAGIYLPRLTSAITCSTSGAILIFIGMCSLLIYKGTMPIRIIAGKMPFYAIVFAVMAVFGTAEQLLLCKTQKKGEKGKNKPDENGKIVNWRRS